MLENIQTQKESSVNEHDEVQLTLFEKPASEETEKAARRVGPPPPPLPANTDPDLDPDTGEMMY